MARDRPSWWGSFDLEEGRTGRWRVGPLELWIERRAHEWRVRHMRSDDHLDARVEVDVPASSSEAPPESELNRFALRRTSQTVRVSPLLADRPVVVRPATPFHLMAGEEATLYVSTPLWVSIDSPTPLLDLPSFRPSDTWFGPNTMRGELCYASRTAAELDLDHVVVRPARAITTLRLHNRAADPVLVERMNLPTRHLSLFVDDRGAFWTDRLTVTRESRGDESSVRVDAGAPPAAPSAMRFADPRDAEDRSTVVRAFSALLG